MVDPKYNLYTLSVEQLISESIAQAKREMPEPHEYVYITNNEIDATDWELGSYYGYYPDESDDIEVEDVTMHDPREFFGEDYIMSPLNIIKIGNANIHTVIAMAESLIEDSNLLGYGMVLSDGKGRFINPLHPIVAQDIVRNGIPMEDYEIIYYALEQDIAIFKNTYYGSENKHIMSEVAKSLGYSEYSSENTEYIMRKYMEETEGLEYYVSINKEIEIGNQPNLIITPVHLADVNGIIYPYYGTIQSKRGRHRFDSINLSPFVSGNVNNSTSLVDDIEEDHNTIYVSTEYSNTCIGKYSNSEWTNLRHMNIMNAGSMYMSHTIPENWADYVHHCISTSITILKEGILNEQKDRNEEDGTQSRPLLQLEQNVDTAVEAEMPF